MTEIVLIAAVADNGVIGAGGAIPWRLRSDLRRFKTLTMGKPVIMGRKTFLSLPHPLPGRTNIVLTRDREFRARGAIVVTSAANALAVAIGDAFRRFASEIAVIGGAEIYAEWIADADRLEITEVHAAPVGDTRFPPIDKTIWRENARTEHRAGADDDSAFAFVSYVRRTPN